MEDRKTFEELESIVAAGEKVRSLMRGKKNTVTLQEERDDLYRFDALFDTDVPEPEEDAEGAEEELLPMATYSEFFVEAKAKGAFPSFELPKVPSPPLQKPIQDTKPLEFEVSFNKGKAPQTPSVPSFNWKPRTFIWVISIAAFLIGDSTMISGCAIPNYDGSFNIGGFLIGLFLALAGIATFGIATFVTYSKQKKKAMEKFDSIKAEYEKKKKENDDLVAEAKAKLEEAIKQNEANEKENAALLAKYKEESGACEKVCKEYFIKNRKKVAEYHQKAKEQADAKLKEAEVLNRSLDQQGYKLIVDTLKSVDVYYPELLFFQAERFLKQLKNATCTTLSEAIEQFNNDLVYGNRDPNVYHVAAKGIFEGGIINAEFFVNARNKEEATSLVPFGKK